MTDKKSKTLKIDKVYITDKGIVFDDTLLKKYEVPSTKQIFEEEKWGPDIIEPPYDLKRLLAWSELSVVHSACIRTKVQDAFGVGYKLKAKETEAKAEVEEDVQAAGIKKLTQFFNKVNEAEDIISVCKKVGADYEGCGNGYFEVIRATEEGGGIKSIYHVNATTIRACKDKLRYVQQVQGKQIYFKRFGVDKILDKDSGQFVAQVTPERLAGEIIQVKQYTPRSNIYGLPVWLPAIYQMWGEQQAQNYNLDFFTNFGVPAYAVVLEGGEMTPETKDEIKKYFEVELKGNPHRAMVFSTPEGAKLRFERLSIETKDASFRIYHQDNRDDLLTAHGVPPYRASIVIKGQLGGSVAADVDRIYLDSIINPRQRDFCWVINELLIWEGFNLPNIEFEFEDVDVRDRQADANIDAMYFNMGARTPNDILRAQGKEPYDGGDVYYLPGALIPVGMTKEAADEAAAKKPKPEAEPIGKPADDKQPAGAAPAAAGAAEEAAGPDVGAAGRAAAAEEARLRATA